MNYQTPTLRRALAGDYAIGLMPPAASKRFEQLLVDDAGLREELAITDDGDNAVIALRACQGYVRSVTVD